jgi:hypothetical protein
MSASIGRKPSSRTNSISAIPDAAATRPPERTGTTAHQGAPTLMTAKTLNVTTRGSVTNHHARRTCRRARAARAVQAVGACSDVRASPDHASTWEMADRVVVSTKRKPVTAAATVSVICSIVSSADISKYRLSTNPPRAATRTANIIDSATLR